MKYLVIVESPSKARTIERYLGKDYRVLSSMGHIRDLPQRELGVDVEKDFEPTLIVTNRKQAMKLRQEAKSAEEDDGADPLRRAEGAGHARVAAEGLDDEALDGFDLLARSEGILPALEPSHAIAHLRTLAKELGKGKRILLLLSGRGDKDLNTVAKARGVEL